MKTNFKKQIKKCYKELYEHFCYNILKSRRINLNIDIIHRWALILPNSYRHIAKGAFREAALWYMREEKSMLKILYRNFFDMQYYRFIKGKDLGVQQPTKSKAWYRLEAYKLTKLWNRL